VFLNHLGIPAADLSFDGPYGVYHSIYDNHNWVAKIGDPGFRYHVALVQLWGVATLRLAEADIIPLDYEPYAAAMATFADDLERRGGGEVLKSGDFAPLRAAIGEMNSAAQALNSARDTALARGDGAAAAAINRKLMLVERALLDPAGIPKRPWYRHQIYAPKYTYAPELFPGVAEAIEAADAIRARAQLRALVDAIQRAAAAMK
jgi:N-acetylated-alpha-linked acidic dipeptidase